ncbi:restriction endonuclease subunit S [Acinetobacter towneri]|uniref:restriction endonuclease subunit S n=1 Tax=Acinetobacter towneri TaxID=202956 RepID=UPI001F46D678|nr:restriction endonuclease subunit S [Acinetobacter towneri]UIP26004.1 restriction endonuclease subunit S [Acinetobacter towneri]
MATYQAYAEYKDSGVEWLEVIPSHWTSIAIKFLALDKNSLFLDGDWIESKDISDSGIRYITTGNVGTGFYKEQGSGFITEFTFKKLSCSEVYAGDILISRLNLPIGRACIVPDLNNRIVTSVDNVIFRPDEEYHPKFLVYLFSSKEYFQNTENIARGATMQRISRGLLGNIRVVMPSKDEQTQIANFLDHETAKIDHLIEKQQQLIELLKEKRQAVISHAVTKGLDPNVPMKDSGVEWLGEVPEHWVIPRLKQLIKYGSSISYGIVQPGDALDEGIPFIQTTNISKGSFELQDFQKTSVAIESNYPRSRLEGGEVILGIRASIGAAFVVPMSFKGVNLSRGIARIIPNALLKSDFLVWYFKSNAVDQYWGLSKQGSTFSEVSIETVRELSVVVPPIDEQEKISEFLSFELGKLERLISSAENQKLLLLERRTALISAAVTGKIDVRNWQAPTVAEAHTELSA